MMTDKRLGKIQKVSFGLGGYQDVCLGIHFVLGGDGWGVGDGKDSWDANLIKCGQHCNWTEKDRSEQYDKIMRYVSDLLHAAKVDSVDKLCGVPVEVEFEGMALKGWRILTEVL